ncbi:MAG: beta-N-acetylhexosaminidase [Vicinamibacteraceae bacterium]|nr:beta-N-acetylhexosaminidase [Vicinamibacteraceae bacterium]
MSLRALRRRVGQLLFTGFGGPTIPPETRALAREFGLGGVVLFKRNVEEPAQVAELAYDAATLRDGDRLWVAVDQEGGRVARLRAPFTEWPPMLALGRADDPALAGRFATALARELRAVGITMDFAPVVDVLTNPANPVIGDRALSEDAATVARLARQIVEALQAEGLPACAKHFPGHGDASVDSHHALPLIEHPPDRFEAVEFLPFREVIAAGVASVMVGHLHVPAFDEVNPASVSREVVTGLLRGRLGFDGVVFTDDLEMKALASHATRYGVFADAIAAGCDVGLICGTDYDRQAAALEGLIRALEDETIPIARLDEALARTEALKARWLSPAVPRPLDARRLAAILGSAEHQRVAESLARWA